MRAAFLELTEPYLGDVLARLGARPAVVVPLLLTPAYHARTDLPGVVDTARSGGARIEVAGILGPTDPTDLPAELISAMRRRLVEATPAARPDAPVRPDALVLAAAGSRDAEALRTVERVAAAMSAATGLPCRAGYASGAGEPVGDAVAALRAAGARTVAMASYFLAPGLLHDRAREAATESGVIAVAEPIAAAPAAAALVRRRVVEMTLPVPVAA